MRFCAANKIAPTEVEEAVIDQLMNYRAKLGKSHEASDRRLIARAWNVCAKVVQGWPPRQLVVPPVKSVVQVPWEAFPEGLRRDVDQYLSGLTRVRRGRNGQRIRPLKASTIETRRHELVAAARMAVKTGVLIEALTSLTALLAPDVAEKILDAYWTKDGETPKAYTIDLACHFLAIASEMKCLDDADLERLNEMRVRLEEHRSGGLTDKNLALIRQVLTPGVWSRVLRLPRGHDGDGSAAPRGCTGEVGGDRADRRRYCHPLGRAGAASQSHRNPARLQPGQARRTYFDLPAVVPGL
jgi:hypothetical protein